MTALAGRCSFDSDAAASSEGAEGFVGRMLEHMLGAPARDMRLIKERSAVFARGHLGSPSLFRPPSRTTRAHSERAAGVTVIADARLDDDDAIDCAWRRGVDLNVETPDEAAIHAAYLRWGDECARHLNGDYAFAVHDSAKRKVLLARSFLGTRSLYYHASSRALSFATEAHALFLDGSLLARPNLDCVAQFLSNDYCDNGPTLWRDVLSILPGQTVVFEGTRTRALTHAEVEPGLVLPRQGDEEYAALVTEGLQRAVRRRMNRAAGIGVTLSGGTDSSSVACMAERVRRHTGWQPAPVLALHSRFGNLSCDETVQSDAVVRRWALRTADNEALLDATWSAPSRALKPGAPPYFPGAFAFDAHFASATAHGVDTVLTGEGGDLCLTRTRYDHVERVKGGDLRRVLRETCRPLLSVGGLKRGYELTLRQAIPWRLRAAVAPFRAPQPDPILSVAWQKTVEGQRREKEVAWERAVSGDRRQALLVRGLHDGGQQFCTGRLAYFARRRGLTLEHPFLDADLVRLLLRLPAEQQHAPFLRKPKPVLRRAMRDLLPAEVYRRGSSAEYSDFVRANVFELHQAGFAAVSHPERLIETGLVRPNLRLNAPDASDPILVCRNLTAIAMELWLRQLHP